MTLEEALPLIRASAKETDRIGGDLLQDLGPFGSLVAALLLRQISPPTVQNVVSALRDEGLLDPIRLDQADAPEIQDALRGKVKAISARTIAPLKHLARWIVLHHGGRAEGLIGAHRSIDDLTAELASIRGVGQVGADTILLAGLRRPAYPVDRGTYRILVRHGWLDLSATYEDARDEILHRAGHEVDGLLELAAGMDVLSRDYCRASAPRCSVCPLRVALPESGPLGGEDEG